MSTTPAVARQPYLHDLVTCLAAPCTVLSDPDGQLRPHGAQGAFVADVRVLSEATVSVDGSAPEPISHSSRGPGEAEFIAVVRGSGDRSPDPTVWLRRRRVADVGGVREELTVVNRSAHDVRTTLSLRQASDLAEIERVKAGLPSASVRPAATSAGVRYGAGRVGVDVIFPGARLRLEEFGVQADWDIVVGARSEVTVGWSLAAQDPDAVVIPAAVAAAPWTVRVVADDRRLAPLLQRSVSDLQALRISLRSRPDDDFFAAGSPWYLTLFGRDSIWAARMTLPLGTDLAGGTLRTLASRQGAQVDPATDEQPGKILHELRRSSSTRPREALPPVYYGTVDATPLWVCLLADAWRWGLPAEQVRALLPTMERALAWMVDHGDADGDGFLDYHDHLGRGLANQGWKDSGDSVRFADGTVAVGPVALAEVQGYAYEAALAGADLLDAFGRPGAAGWRCYAAEMADRFRATFWVTDDLGRYPALALDRNKRAVDAPASNMGHLLATGMLSAAEVAVVADRLVHPSMSSGFGLRTMSDSANGYSPLSYHCGSVWPHDTAIAVRGLIKVGLVDHAAELAKGLLAAGSAFDGRLPELFGGFAADDLPAPPPYPASCRPQAWAAAAAVVMLQAFLGLEPDVPRGVVHLRPSTTVGALSVSGLRVAGAGFDVAIDSSGAVAMATAADGLSIQVG